MRPDRRLLAVLLAGVALWTVAFAGLLGPARHAQIDLVVYRLGGATWLHGLPLYGPSFPAPLPGPGLPFTYPPVAAVLFAGLALLPWWAAVAVVVGSGVGGLALACRLTTARLGIPDPTTRVAVLALGAIAAAPLLEPVRETVSLGQINLLLIGAIAADCLLRRTPWPRGMLIGLVAAIKLTPAAFVLFFVARRQWRPVLVAALSFIAAALLGLLLAPRDTRDYWFGALLDPARIGHLEFTSNQSIRGLLHRFELPAGLETAAWLGLSAAIGVLALFGVAALRQRGDDVAAMLVTAAAILLVSPVSWSHHWVWAVLGLLWLAEYANRAGTRASLAALLGTLAVFVVSPFWWLPYREGREFGWSIGEHLAGNAYVWVALATVAAGAVVAVRERRTRTAPDGPLTAISR